MTDPMLHGCYLVECLRNRMATATKQLPDEWQDFAVEFTNDLTEALDDITRAQASATDKPVEWGNAFTVGQLISQLRTLDPAASIHGAYFVDIDGKKVPKVRGVTLSREHVDGNTIRGGDNSVPLQHVIWTQPDTRSNAKAGEVESVYVECRQCDVCDHIGINDASTTEGACHNCDWRGPEQVEDKCPECGNTDCMAAACPECGGRYALITDTRIDLSTHDKTKA